MTFTLLMSLTVAAVGFALDSSPLKVVAIGLAIGGILADWVETNRRHQS